MSVEKSFSLYKLSKRSDILIYNRQALPVLIVECKAPEVKLTRGVFDQIIRYNLTFKVNFLVVTNGLQHFCCQLDHGKNSAIFLNDIPDFNMLIAG